MDRLFYYTSGDKHYVFHLVFIVDSGNVYLKINIHEIINPNRTTLNIIVNSINANSSNPNILSSFNNVLKVSNSYNVNQAMNIINMMVVNNNKRLYNMENLIKINGKFVNIDFNQGQFNFIYGIFTFFVNSYNEIHKHLTMQTINIPERNELKITFDDIFNLFSSRAKSFIIPFLNRKLAEQEETNTSIIFDSIVNFELIQFYEDKRCMLFEVIESMTVKGDLFQKLITIFLLLQKEKDYESNIKKSLISLALFFMTLKHIDKDQSKSFLVLHELNLVKFYENTINYVIGSYCQKNNINIKHISFRYNYDDTIITNSINNDLETVKYLDIDDYIKEYSKIDFRIIKMMKFYSPQMIDVSQLETVTKSPYIIELDNAEYVNKDVFLKRYKTIIADEIIPKLFNDESDLINDMLYLYNEYLSHYNIQDSNDIRTLMYNVIMAYLHKNKNVKYFFNIIL